MCIHVILKVLMAGNMTLVYRDCFPNGTINLTPEKTCRDEAIDRNEGHSGNFRLGIGKAVTSSSNELTWVDSVNLCHIKG